MPPVKTYCHACFAQAKDATSSFAQGQRQPSTNHIRVQKRLIPKLCITRTINLSNTQFRYQSVFFIHKYEDAQGPFGRKGNGGI